LAYNQPIILLGLKHIILVVSQGSRQEAAKMSISHLASMQTFCAALIAVGAAGAAVAAADLNDYPTGARADYVFACMKTNGETRQALEQCSCSIDVIASIIPYERYLAAETVLSLSQVPGRFGAMFRTPEQAKSATNDLRRAQAEAEVRCF
jgi:hypothetical protein